jgi:hypothetical protein
MITLPDLPPGTTAVAQIPFTVRDDGWIALGGDENEQLVIRLPWLAANATAITVDTPTDNGCTCCGACPIKVYEDGFTRGLCEACNDRRCDITPGCPHRRLVPTENGCKCGTNDDIHAVDCPADTDALDDTPAENGGKCRW